jgi:hypothetical protein
MKTTWYALVAALAFFAACGEKTEETTKDEQTETPKEAAAEKKSDVDFAKEFEETISVMDVSKIEATEQAAEKYNELAADASDRERDEMFDDFFLLYRRVFAKNKELERLEMKRRMQLGAYMADGAYAEQAEKDLKFYKDSPYDIVFYGIGAYPTLTPDYRWIEENLTTLGPESKRFLEFMKFKEENNIYTLFAEFEVNLKNAEQIMLRAGKILEEHPAHVGRDRIELEFMSALTSYFSIYNEVDESSGIKIYDHSAKKYTPEMQKRIRNFANAHPDTWAGGHFKKMLDMLERTDFAYEGPAQAYHEGFQNKANQLRNKIMGKENQ